MELVHETRRVIRDHRLILPGDRVICAVSGGPDSMALWHVLNRLAAEEGFAVTAAHLNHGFRGAEAEREARMVAEYAAGIGAELVCGFADVPAVIRETGGNAQATAREMRYRFLRETAEKRGARLIALAHHADDQAETVLMHALRGASLSGLAGMPLRRAEGRVELIRPFLRIYKRELIEYCVRHGIPYASDSSNDKPDYTRNRIRLEVMPLLSGINPRFPESLCRLADIVREEDAFVESAAAEAAGRIVRFSEGACRFSRKDFSAEPIALQRRLIKLILYYLSGDSQFPDFSKIESIRSAIVCETPPSLSLDVGASIRMRRAYDGIALYLESGGRQDRTAYEFRIGGPDGDVFIPAAGGRLTIRTAAAEGLGGSIPVPPGEAWFDEDALRFPLTVRSRRAGDRIELMGMDGSKKVKDLFIDLKIDPDWRDRVPLVADADGRVLWIAGIRRSRHAPVTGATKRVTRIRFRTEEDGLPDVPPS